jgi:hypothetical protein
MATRFATACGIVLIGMAAAVTVGARGQAPAGEPGLARTISDPSLKWSACPPFLPVGCSLAVLHGDPAQPNADIFLKLPGKSTVIEHTHTSAERMVLILGELHVTYGSQPTSVLRPGTYAYGPAKMPHKATCASSTPCVLFIAFESAVDGAPTGTP